MVWRGLVWSSLALFVRGENEQCFPANFMMGTATAAYQVEGGWNETGRGPSIWDGFCREREDVACANVADDVIHRYLEDIDRMSEMGLQSFRFSISWSRAMQWNGTQMIPNLEGLAFYHRLIQALKAKNIIPLLTMYHWDLPLELHTELSPPGWLNPAIVDHFQTYADVLFHAFGSDVASWATFNEPWTFTTLGYGIGNHAPGMANSTTNAYVAAHHVLLSHAHAVANFRALKATNVVRQDARISIVLNCDYGEPLDPLDPRDIATAERKMQFVLGWYLNPIVSGDYPPMMKQYAGDHLPVFTAEESALLKGSYDLLMLNHYSTKLVTDCDGPDSTIACDSLSPGWHRDLGVDASRFPDGARLSSTNAEGERNCEWFSGYPKGYAATIRWMHQQDRGADILLTENGWCGNATIDNTDQLWYYQAYLKEVLQAIQDGIPIIGYTAWSLLDNYEWGSFQPRFGLFYVEYPAEVGSASGYLPQPTDLQRIARPAAHFIAQVAQTKCLSPDLTAASTPVPSPVPVPRSTSWIVQSFILFSGIGIIVLAVSLLRTSCCQRHPYQRIE